VQVITAALQAKKWFIEIDEFDRAERLLLNYGHTFGHALEASSNFAIAHGVAVALGMLVSIQYAHLVSPLTGIGARDSKKLDQYIKLLLTPLKIDIQAALQKMDMNIVMDKFEGDKKHRQNQYRMVIPSSEGGLILHSSPKNEDSREIIKKAFQMTFANHGYISS
jgi:3-dehydroquinate synthase